MAQKRRPSGSLTMLGSCTTVTSGNPISVLFGNGDGTLQSETLFAAGSGSGAVVAGDLNGDGRVDVITANKERIVVGPVSGLVWWEAPADRRAGTWIPHMIDPEFIVRDSTGPADAGAAERTAPVVAPALL